MSKFINAAKLTKSVEQRAKFAAKFANLKATMEYSNDRFSAQSKFHYSVTWENHAWLDEYSDPKSREVIFSNFRKELIEAVYGDFRNLVNELEVAVYEEDYMKAKKIIYAIRSEIES